MNGPRAALRILGAAGLCLLNLHCAARSLPDPAAAPRDYPGRLIAPSELPGEFMARQAIEARYGKQQVRFKSVLQKRGDTLSLLGMTPFGTRAFLLEQHGTDVEFTPYIDRILPFPPRYILIDIHRALFMGISAMPLADGRYTLKRDGEEIQERWQDGRVLKRTFRRMSNLPPGLIEITCNDGMTFGYPPGRLEFRNEWFGYELTIDTQSVERLQPSR